MLYWYIKFAEDYSRKDEFSTRHNRLNVTGNEDSRISSLQSNRQTLEEVFDFHSRGLSPSACFYSGQHFEEGGGDWIPSAERLDDERLEENALCTTVFKVHTDLGRFSSFLKERRTWQTIICEATLRKRGKTIFFFSTVSQETWITKENFWLWKI